MQNNMASLLIIIHDSRIVISNYGTRLELSIHLEIIDTLFHLWFLVCFLIKIHSAVMHLRPQFSTLKLTRLSLGASLAGGQRVPAELSRPADLRGPAFCLEPVKGRVKLKEERVSATSLASACSFSKVMSGRSASASSMKGTRDNGVVPLTRFLYWANHIHIIVPIPKTPHYLSNYPLLAPLPF